MPAKPVDPPEEKAADEEQPEEPKPVSVWRRLPRWMWAVFAIAVVAGAWQVYTSVQAARPKVLPAWAPLQLRAEAMGRKIRLTWEADAPVVQNAMQATLKVRDGETITEVDLEPARLKKGALVYVPVTADVAFRLSVTSAALSLTLEDTVRVVRGRTVLSEVGVEDPPK